MPLLRDTLHLLLTHWYKAAIVAGIITLIVLVSVKVRAWNAARPARARLSPQRATCAAACAQGFSIFGDILSWFQAHNGWGGWASFLGLYTALVRARMWACGGCGGSRSARAPR